MLSCDILAGFALNCWRLFSGTMQADDLVAVEIKIIQ